MENIILWIGIIFVIVIATFIMFFKYIIYGLMILLSGGIIFTLKKLGFVSETIGNYLLIGLIGFVIISFISSYVKKYFTKHREENQGRQ